MLAEGFSERFDQRYGKKLKEKVEELLKSKTLYHDKISDLKIDSKEGVIQFEDPYSFCWPNNQKEVISVSEAYEVIKRYVWTSLDFCMISKEEEEEITKDLESFLEAHPND